MTLEIGERKLEQARLSRWWHAVRRWLVVWRAKMSPGGRQVVGGDDLSTADKVQVLCADLSSIWGGSRVIILKRLTTQPCNVGLYLLKSEFNRSRFGGCRGHTIQLARGCTESELALALTLAGGVKWSVRVPARLAVFKLLVGGQQVLCSAEDFVLMGGNLPHEVEVFGADGPDWVAKSA